MTRKFGRTKAHREHMLTNMSRLLVNAEKLETTLPKAKEVRAIVERWVTLAKQVVAGTGSAALASRRRLYASVGNDDVARKLVDDLAKRTAKRPGGYTRILKTGFRVGDAAPKAKLMFVDVPTRAEQKTAKTSAVSEQDAAKATE